MTKYEIRYTRHFKKDIKPAKKQKLNIDLIFDVINKLADGITLDPKY